MDIPIYFLLFIPLIIVLIEKIVSGIDLLQEHKAHAKRVDREMDRFGDSLSDFRAELQEIRHEMVTEKNPTDKSIKVLAEKLAMLQDDVKRLHQD